ncbi:MAG TPA: hypothetical protein VLU06_00720 [Thermoanaerobaculia bacterium]|nr:hypothetical protein [Thermoanaerobaculia bacterium]
MRIWKPLALCLGVIALAARASRGQEATPPPQPTPAPTAEPASPAPQPTPPPPAAAPAQTSTYFNPSIAVIGNFLAIIGHNPVDNQPSLQMRESEVSLQAIVDPYARADFFISVSNDSVTLEEGYATFNQLPAGLLLKVGELKAQFGRINTLHLHVLPWADEPLPMINLLGSEDGWSDAGISLARIFPLPGDTFSELTGQVFHGVTDGLFDAPSRGDVSYCFQYRAYRDFGDDHNVELGTSFGRGFNGTTPDATTTLENIHLIYRWKPLQGRPYRSFILRSELFRSRREQPGGTQTSRGFFVSGDYQLARRWYTGARYEFSDHANDQNARDSGEALTLTFWPSEFSQLRGELRRRRYAGGVTANEALVQLQFAIGAHGAHPF